MPSLTTGNTRLAQARWDRKWSARLLALTIALVYVLFSVVSFSNCSEHTLRWMSGTILMATAVIGTTGGALYDRSIKAYEDALALAQRAAVV